MRVHIRARAPKVSEDSIEPESHRTPRYWSLYKGTRTEKSSPFYIWKRQSNLSLPWDQAMCHWARDITGFVARGGEADGELLQLRVCPPPILDQEEEEEEGERDQALTTEVVEVIDWKALVKLRNQYNTDDRHTYIVTKCPDCSKKRVVRLSYEGYQCRSCAHKNNGDE